MTREEREMDIWQRAYEHVPFPTDDPCRKRSADAALAAFREAFPGSKCAFVAKDLEGNVFPTEEP